MPQTDERYREATSRNLGLISENEQDVLRHAKVAIAGMGAVGGHYLLALARLGVGKFAIADPDVFETVNFHRQAGAFAHTMGKRKVEAMAEMVRAINPDAEIATFSEGLTEENADEFLAGANLVLDGIDFFQIDARRLLFRKAREKGLYAITSGPIGYGASLQIYDPSGMKFDEYFGIKAGMTRAERLAAFTLGIMPEFPPRGIRVDGSRVDFVREKGPALISTIMLCAGVVATESLRILSKRARPKCVPFTSYFDPYLGRYVTRRRRGILRILARKLIFGLMLKQFPSLKQLHLSEKQPTA